MATGHLEGDRLLKMIGSTLIALCRKDDIVYRFGGDEFAILLKDVQTDNLAIQKARNIIDAITKIDNNYKNPPTCSVGICFRDGDTVGSEEMIRRADAALYCAKRKGKNRFEVWPADAEGHEEHGPGEWEKPHPTNHEDRIRQADDPAQL